MIKALRSLVMACVMLPSLAHAFSFFNAPQEKPVDAYAKYRVHRYRYRVHHSARHVGRDALPPAQLNYKPPVPYPYEVGNRIYHQYSGGFPYDYDRLCNASEQP